MKESSLDPRSAGSLLQSLRKHRRGGGGPGPKPRPTNCPRCGVPCPSVKLAKGHPRTQACAEAVESSLGKSSLRGEGNV
jgi:hypothetical protein